MPVGTVCRCGTVITGNASVSPSLNERVCPQCGAYESQHGAPKPRHLFQGAVTPCAVCWEVIEFYAKDKGHWQGQPSSCLPGRPQICKACGHYDKKGELRPLRVVNQRRKRNGLMLLTASPASLFPPPLAADPTGYVRPAVATGAALLASLAVDSVSAAPAAPSPPPSVPRRQTSRSARSRSSSSSPVPNSMVPHWQLGRCLRQLRGHRVPRERGNLSGLRRLRGQCMVCKEHKRLVSRNRPCDDCYQDELSRFDRPKPQACAGCGRKDKVSKSTGRCLAFDGKGGFTLVHRQASLRPAARCTASSTGHSVQVWARHPRTQFDLASAWDPGLQALWRVRGAKRHPQTPSSLKGVIPTCSNCGGDIERNKRVKDHGHYQGDRSKFLPGRPQVCRRCGQYERDRGKLRPLRVINDYNGQSGIPLVAASPVMFHSPVVVVAAVPPAAAIPAAHRSDLHIVFGRQAAASDRAAHNPEHVPAIVQAEVKVAAANSQLGQAAQAYEAKRSGTAVRAAAEACSHNDKVGSNLHLNAAAHLNFRRNTPFGPPSFAAHSEEAQNPAVKRDLSNAPRFHWHCRHSLQEALHVVAQDLRRHSKTTAAFRRISLTETTFSRVPGLHSASRLLPR
ncbi:hypothetical protein A1Q1_02177 [Trichosporon asahii var. asahii CBS 2479]|uniref:Uncharacterized protein n=1 Tax=Trichosporon asahii var. asahii (strain ATCC 90039 / CBS 2479 / JCM 2466 / KCTC 7840 / NBRC 103889/ NCYC 2677 / UAMH 7654) TaxID=1186058 RepID=J6F104_TRIAS|nr:hypothetical protein A1Q1_02177 [Trichosporon asahii var. asahii CBS 2479]EJT48842.1 hypothetical protein A1Q1_02177 [Trichosporon asahii var. asahii CBS 2479]